MKVIKPISELFWSFPSLSLFICKTRSHRSTCTSICLVWLVFSHFSRIYYSTQSSLSPDQTQHWLIIGAFAVCTSVKAAFLYHNLPSVSSVPSSHCSVERIQVSLTFLDFSCLSYSEDLVLSSHSHVEFQDSPLWIMLLKLLRQILTPLSGTASL